MSWVRLDDQFPDHEKIAGLSDAAFRAHVTALCYSARQLTDGYFPVRKGKEWAGRPRVVQELVPALWEPTNGGFRIHDYLEYNPPRERVLAEREAAKQRMQSLRSKDVRPNILETCAVGSGSPHSPFPIPDPVPVPDPPVPDAVAERRNIFVLYDMVFTGGINGLLREELIALEEEHPADCIEHCFKAAAMANPRPRTLLWVKARLEAHRRDGCDGKPDRTDRSKPAEAGDNPRVAARIRGLG